MLAVLSAAAVVALVIWRGVPLAQAAFGYAINWFLLLGGVRPVLGTAAVLAPRTAARSDADQLARLTGLPAGAWIGLFALVAVGAVAASALWLMY